ncbi:hypothetical protein HDV01_007923 [Terramyces sp. JEL0728]|nr:hypothetical protein HDV01_007923 [Terramyces sp. JEL0728]
MDSLDYLMGLIDEFYLEDYISDYYYIIRESVEPIFGIAKLLTLMDLILVLSIILFIRNRNFTIPALAKQAVNLYQFYAYCPLLYSANQMYLLMLMEFNLEFVFIFDSEGKKLLSKYYYPIEKKDSQKLEKTLFEKTRKTNSDIILFDNLVVVYKPVVDLFIYVVGGLDENEIMLVGVLNCFIDACSNLLKNQMEKRSLMDNLDTVLLVLDETIDDGVILETDSSVVCSRVAKLQESIPIADQTLSSVWKSAQDQLKRSSFFS